MGFRRIRLIALNRMMGNVTTKDCVKIKTNSALFEPDTSTFEKHILLCKHFTIILYYRCHTTVVIQYSHTTFFSICHQQYVNESFKALTPKVEKLVSPSYVYVSRAENRFFSRPRWFSANTDLACVA